MTVYELAIVLLEFRQAPEQDRWLANWQRELAESLPTVIQWALGRVPAEVRRKLPQDRWPDELSAAALFVVKRTCFATDASHYQIFGLEPGPISQGTLRTRYRALIRLTHPDVGVSGLPVNAAGRVNRAYAVLGNDNTRRAYDEQLAAAEPEPVQPARQDAETPQREANRSSGRREACNRESGHRVHDQAGLGERILARWVWVNARWSRQLRVVLIGLAIFVATGLVVFWNVSETREVNTIVALAPESGAVGNPMIQDDALPVSAAKQTQAGRQPHGFVKHAVPALPADAPRGSGDAVAALNQPGQARPDESSGPALDAGYGAVAARQAEGGSSDDARRQGWATAERTQQPHGTDSGADAAMGEAGRTPDQGRGSAVIASEAASAPGIASRGKQRVTPAAALQDKHVDWPAARRYLQDITGAVGDKSETRWLNDYLEQMNVKGSLLRPIIVLHDRYGDLSTQYSTWSMAEGNGLFDAETTLTVHALSGQGSQAALSFLLRAQFQATEAGTRLKALDLLPIE